MGTSPRRTGEYQVAARWLRPGTSLFDKALSRAGGKWQTQNNSPVNFPGSWENIYRKSRMNNICACALTADAVATKRQTNPPRELPVNIWTVSGSSELEHIRMTHGRHDPPVSAIRQQKRKR